MGGGAQHRLREPMFSYPEETLAGSLALQNTAVAILALLHCRVDKQHWVRLPLLFSSPQKAS